MRRVKLSWLIAVCVCLSAISYLVISNIWMLHRSKAWLELPTEAISKEAALVLGAGVYGDKLSGVLHNRMMTALQLYRQHLVNKVLISGDGEGPFYNETAAMKRFALRAGIQNNDLLIDPLGESTYDSIQRAHDIFGIRSVYIISQKFHLPRALWIAAQFRLDARGVIAPDVNEGNVGYEVREWFARSKDLIQVPFLQYIQTVL